jgi:hydrogenase nickel incorporation protein HypB
VADPVTIPVGESLKARNDRQAAANRALFRAHGLLVLNLLSSPGSGKTALLERTLSEYGTRRRLGVVVGDLQTDNDARRLAGRGGPVVPITTGTVCHLEADMVARACAGLDLAALDVLAIENVGNLVCPASFDLGEDVRVVVLSTTEGEDKPLKYPRAFKTAQVVVVNKTDIAGVVGFDRAAALRNIRDVTPQAEVLEVSARTGAGMDGWYACLERALAARAG